MLCSFIFPVMRSVMHKRTDNKKSQFDAIVWPEEFIVEFKDGVEQVFISSHGVCWDDGRNYEGKDEYRENISCCWKRKSPSQQRYRLIEFFVDEVKEFRTLSGVTIWNPNA